MTDDQKQKRFLVRRTVEELVQESHRAGRVSERSQPGLMDGRDQKAGRDSD